MPELERARGREQAAYLSIRVLAVAAIGFVVITSFQARPAPGGHGEALGVAAALIVFCGATIAAMWLTQAGSAAQLAVLLVAVVSAAALIGVQGNGAAFLGVFPAVCLAALVLPVRLSALVAAVAAAAVSAAWLANGHAPIAGIVLNDFAILAFYLLSLFARRLRESNQRAELLLAELEQTRAAQARAAALAERQRLAREMHDVLAHALSGLVLNLEGARLLAAHGGADPQVGDAIERAHRLARTGLGEARRAIGMLRDDALPGPERLAGLCSPPTPMTAPSSTRCAPAPADTSPKTPAPGKSAKRSSGSPAARPPLTPRSSSTWSTPSRRAHPPQPHRNYPPGSPSEKPKCSC